MKKSELIEEIRHEQGCGLPLKNVSLALATFVVLAALMNGPGLSKKASLMKFGRTRDLWIAGTKPLAAAGDLTRLSALRKWIESQVNLEKAK
jgi:hypothetical protein